MGPFEMHRVDRVLLALEPVARDLGLDDLAEPVLPREEFPIRHQGARLRAEIGPEEAAQLFDRVGLDTDLILETGLGMRQILVGLHQNAAVGAVEPAMVVAAQPAFLDIAIAEVGAAMPAMAVEEPVAAAEILVEDEVLAQEPHRHWSRLRQLAGAGDRPPVAAQQFAHPCPGAGLGQDVPAAAGWRLAIVGHDESRVLSDRLIAAPPIPPRQRHHQKVPDPRGSASFETPASPAPQDDVLS